LGGSGLNLEILEKKIKKSVSLVEESNGKSPYYSLYSQEIPSQGKDSEISGKFFYLEKLGIPFLHWRVVSEIVSSKL